MSAQYPGPPPIQFKQRHNSDDDFEDEEGDQMDSEDAAKQFDTNLHDEVDNPRQKHLSTSQQLAVKNLGDVPCTACTGPLVARCRLDMNFGHTYCKTCIVFMVELAVQDITTWPAKCCSPITPIEVASLVLPDLQAHYAVRSIEWGTGDPTYCHDPGCSSFIVHSD